MKLTNDNIKALATVLSQTLSTDGPQPAGFLLQTMAGYDPRDLDSDLYRFVSELDLESDEVPDMHQWGHIKWLVLNSGLYEKHRVSFEESFQAAKELMGYLHPKLSRTKSEHMTTSDETISELTPEEIELFEDWFMSEF